MSTQPVLRPAEISQAEWEVRCNLAACYRVFVRYGWTDMIYTHISARHPVEEGQYLINPYGLLFEEITASNLLVVDWEGNVVSGDYPYNDAGHAIHSAVLKARPDVNWVLHSHTRAGMAVSCMKCGLLPLTQQAMFFHGYISYHPWDLQTAGPEECEALARDLGSRNHVMILNNHGLLTCAPTVGEAFSTMYHVEMACKVQVDVMTSGVEAIIPDAEVLERTAEYGVPGGYFSRSREWDAMIRWLERTDTSYRT
jgi:ribulose-5-phosphate 4-epimerase/fuculose-1-phosphate aldolase